MKPTTQQWIGSNKLLIAFGVLAFCFCVSTIVLALRTNSNGSPCIQGVGRPIAKALASVNLDNKNISYRLPRHVIPINYKLKLEPSMSSSKTFTGSVTIQLNILQPTWNITLHSRKLGIISVDLKNDKLYQNLTTATEPVTDVRDFLIIRTNEELTRGRYTVKIDFSGKFEGLVGFYGSTLKNGRLICTMGYHPSYRTQLCVRARKTYFHRIPTTAMMAAVSRVVIEVKQNG